MPRRRRTRIEIVIDVLRVLAERGEEHPTRIAMYANLSYDRLQKLLSELEAKGIVARTPGGQRTANYRLTEKGYILLRELQRLRKLLEDFGLDIV